MANDVTTTFFANSQAAEAAVAKLEKKYDDLENKMRQVTKRSKESADMPAMVGDWATKVGSVAAGYAGLAGVISGVYQAQMQVNQAADQAVLKYDELIRKLRVQAGMTGAQGAEAQARLTKIAAQTATDFGTAQAGSEELISQGFDAKTGTDAGLKRLLETMKATNADPGQIRETAKAYAALLAATGQEKNAENMEAVTLAVQRTFKGTPLQASDLTQLAPKIQGVSAVVPWDEALAQFAVMREKSSPDVASTNLKQVWERLQTAGSDNQAVSALARMGLTPDQVDATGETPSQVLDRLAGGLDKLKPEERPAVMKQLFGTEAMSGATGLIRDREKVQEYLAMQKDEAGFQEDVRINTRGSAAAKARADLEQEQQMLGKNSQLEEYMRAADLLNREAGATEFALGVHHQQANIRTMFGQDPLTAVADSYVDPEQLKLGWRSNGAPLPPELLEAKVAELRGQIPGGVSAQEFLRIAGDGLSGEEQTKAQRSALTAIQGEEGKTEKLLKENTEATEEQTKVLREYLEKNAKQPKRNPGGD